MTTWKTCALATWVLLALLSGPLPGPDNDKEREQPEKVTLVGVLDMVLAIGGDTTGFALQTTDAEGKPLTQEVSGDAKLLGKFMGKKVTVTGHYYEKKYVERGRVKILAIETIEPAPQAGG